MRKNQNYEANIDIILDYIKHSKNNKTGVFFGGVSRAGKSTLSYMLISELVNRTCDNKMHIIPQYFAGDHIVTAMGNNSTFKQFVSHDITKIKQTSENYAPIFFGQLGQDQILNKTWKIQHENIIDDNKDKRKSRKTNAIVSAIMGQNVDDFNMFSIADSDKILPKEMANFTGKDNLLVFYVGYPNSNPEEFAKAMQKYDSIIEDEQGRIMWTKNKPFDYLLDYAKQMIEHSKFIQAEAEKYGFPFIDVSFGNRNELFTTIGNSIADKIQSQQKQEENHKKIKDIIESNTTINNLIYRIKNKNIATTPKEEEKQEAEEQVLSSKIVSKVEDSNTMTFKVLKPKYEGDEDKASKNFIDAIKSSQNNLDDNSKDEPAPNTDNGKDK